MEQMINITQWSLVIINMSSVQIKLNNVCNTPVLYNRKAGES